MMDVRTRDVNLERHRSHRRSEVEQPHVGDVEPIGQVTRVSHGRR